MISDRRPGHINFFVRSRNVVPCLLTPSHHTFNSARSAVQEQTFELVPHGPACSLMATRYAFVTLLTSDSYLPGALTLVAALRDLHPKPAVEPEVDFQTACLVTPETVDVSSIKLLRGAFDVVIGVEIIDDEDRKGLDLLGKRYSSVFEIIAIGTKRSSGLVYYKADFYGLSMGRYPVYDSPDACHDHPSERSGIQGPVEPTLQNPPN